MCILPLVTERKENFSLLSQWKRVGERKGEIVSSKSNTRQCVCYIKILPRGAWHCMERISTNKWLARDDRTCNIFSLPLNLLLVCVCDDVNKGCWRKIIESRNSAVWWTFTGKYRFSRSRDMRMWEPKKQNTNANERNGKGKARFHSWNNFGESSRGSDQPNNSLVCVCVFWSLKYRFASGLMARHLNPARGRWINQ